MMIPKDELYKAKAVAAGLVSKCTAYRLSKSDERIIDTAKLREILVEALTIRKRERGE